MNRYSRQELFRPIGRTGQQHIRESTVVIVGCGALGTHLAEFCVRAGVGRVRIIDRDIVEPSNLQRQALFTEHHAENAIPKPIAAQEVLTPINRDVTIEPIVGDFNRDNALESVRDATLILDASDNFDARFLINEVAHDQGIPWIYSACVGSLAVAMPVLPSQTACLRCIFEDAPSAQGETCDSVGVIMPAVLQAVAWASGAAIKILSANTDALVPKLLSADVWTGERSAIDASSPVENCPACNGATPYLDGESGQSASVLCGRDSVQISAPSGFDADDVFPRLGDAWDVVLENRWLVRIAQDDLTVTLYRDGRALVHGTDDKSRAQSVYTRIVG